MSTLQYATLVSSEGYVTPLPPEFYGRKVVVLVEEEIDQQQEERRQRIETEKARIMNRTPEEHQAAVDDFMKAWKGCLKGVPHMTAKEIRAERLEKKYGQRGGEE